MKSDNKNIPTYRDIETTLAYMRNRSLEINESIIFYQDISPQKLVNSSIDLSLSWNILKVHEKWTLYFKSCKSEDLNSEFIFPIHAHNAHIKQLFSLINMQWTNKRNRPTLSTIKYNMKMTCFEFYYYI